MRDSRGPSGRPHTTGQARPDVVVARRSVLGGAWPCLSSSVSDQARSPSSGFPFSERVPVRRGDHRRATTERSSGADSPQLRLDHWSTGSRHAVHASPGRWGCSHRGARSASPRSTNRFPLRISARVSICNPTVRLQRSRTASQCARTGHRALLDQETQRRQMP